MNMNPSGIHRPTYTAYPYLTQPEFSEVCHHLDRRYCQATLGPLRRQWRLQVHTALGMSFEPGQRGYTTFVQITRPLDDGTAADSLATKFGDVHLGDEQDDAMDLTADDVMMKMEDSDKVSTAMLTAPVQ